MRHSSLPRAELWETRHMHLEKQSSLIFKSVLYCLQQSVVLSSAYKNNVVYKLTPTLNLSTPFHRL
jgi:hypothetical protein